jgi:hypothetical protein
VRLVPGDQSQPVKPVIHLDLTQDAADADVVLRQRGDAHAAA